MTTDVMKKKNGYLGCGPIAGHTATAVGKEMFIVGGETTGGLSNSVYILNTDVDKVRSREADMT